MDRIHKKTLYKTSECLAPTVQKGDWTSHRRNLNQNLLD